jgi:hypothetical protein
MGMPFLLASSSNHRAFRSEAYDLFIGVDTKVSYNKTNAFVEKKVLMTEAIFRSKKE